MSVQAPRKNTPDVIETRDDGSTSTRFVIKRACNGCDRELGDAHPLEIELAFLGKELPDARDECPDCAEVWRAERAVDDGLDTLFRRLGPPPTDRDNEK